MARKLKTGQEALLAIIGDEDTVTGFLLAGIGDVDSKQNANFLIVDKNTTHSVVEDTFKRFTSRNDIAIILINQHVCCLLRIQW
jgi:V-type H+-transporting ATPase subunit F